jgi:pimeloyl-ACP methyl ester carboxylesterase
LTGHSLSPLSDALLKTLKKFMEIGPMNIASLLFMLLICGLIAALAAMVLMAEGLLRPPRMNDGKAMWVLRRLSPGDLGLNFEETWFRVQDERGGKLRLAAWWIPAAKSSDRCVVLLHGYADAKVGAVAWAPLWHGLGFNVLAIDLRAHGESDGRYCAGGWLERQDVAQAIDQLLVDRPNETRRMVLFGASFGAAVAAATAAMREDIRAVVLDSPYVSFSRAAMRRMDRLGAPGRWFQRPAIWLAGLVAGADLGALSTTESITALRCPVMVILPANDPTLSLEDSEAIRRTVAERSKAFTQDRLWEVAGAGHILALAADAEGYGRELGAFLRGARLGSEEVGVEGKGLRESAPPER